MANRNQLRLSAVTGLAVFGIALGIIQVFAAIVLGFGGFPEWFSMWIFISGWVLSGGNLIWVVIWWGIAVKRRLAAKYDDIPVVSSSLISTPRE